MNRFTNLPLVLAALSLTLVTPLARGAKLSGARPVIDAAEYPSLQAAIDAVPRSGGMLRLPPGEFVLTLGEGKAKLEWIPQSRNRGGRVTREAKLK